MYNYIDHCIKMSIEESKDYKKSIFNKLTYGINKRLLSYEDKIDIIIDKLDKPDNTDINDTNYKKILLLIDTFDEKFKILNDKMIKIEQLLVENIKKNDAVKNENNFYKELKNENNFYKELKNENNFYKELKIETFSNLNINKDFIKECLNMASIHGDIKLFKKIYIENISKEYYPIRHIKKKLQYWADNHMNDDDTNGTYIKNIIFKNIETCYLKINIFEEYIDNTEQFLKNQEHINKLGEQKYKDKFLTKIIQIITI